MYTRDMFLQIFYGAKSHKFSTSIFDSASLYKTTCQWTVWRGRFHDSTATPGVPDKENPVISCLLISTAYEHPKFQTKQWQLECATFSILTLTYGFQVSQLKTLMVGICGFRLTVFWWASFEDSICWWEKISQAERNIMTKYLVYGHNWER